MTTKVCNHCLQEKDEEEFNWRYKHLGIRSRTCRACAHDFNKAYYGSSLAKNDTHWTQL